MRSSLSYFSVLHLSVNSTQEEIEGRVQELSEFLTSSHIPAHLQDWAASEAALVAEAYAVLLDADEGTESSPSEALPAESEATRSSRPAAQVDRRGSSRMAGIVRNPLVVGLVVVISLAAGVFIGQGGLDRGGDEPAPAETNDAGAGDGLDMARITLLINATEEDPANVEALFELGETFFNAQQWQTSIDWFTRLLAIDTNNVHALTDVGTSHFNLGREPEAKAAWESALVLAPEDAQLHYNMGFLYANQDPPDVESAALEWEKVVELAPDSSLAATVQLHLEGLSEERTAVEQP